MNLNAYRTSIGMWFVVCLGMVIAGTGALAQSGWQRAQGPAGSAGEGIVCDSAGTLYVRTDAAIHRSTDHGHTWDTIPGPAPVNSLPSSASAMAVDGRNRLVVIPTGSSSIMRWNTATGKWDVLFMAPLVVPDDTSHHLIYFNPALLAALPNGDVIAAELGGGMLHYSDRDGSVEFTTVTSPHGKAIRFVEALPNGIILVANHGEIYRSINSGATYALVDSSVDVAAFAAVGDVILAAEHGLIASTDNGATWRPRTTGIAAIDTDMVAGVTAGRHGDVVLLTAAGTMWYSRDKAATWQQASAPAITISRAWTLGVVPIAADVDGSFLFGASNNGLMRSADGSSWAPVESNLNTYALEDISEDRARGTLVAALHSFGGPTYVLARSVDDGRTWQKTADVPPETIHLVSASNGRWFAGLSGGTVWRSLDDGVTWSATPALPGLPSLAAIAADGAGTVYAFAYDGQVAASTDAGEHWQPRDTVTFALSDYSIVVAPAPGMLIASSGYRSTDGGSTWDSIPDFPRGVNMLVALADGRLVTRSSQGISASSDSGMHWRLVTHAPWTPFWNGRLYDESNALWKVLTCTLEDTVARPVQGSEFRTDDIFGATVLLPTSRGTLLATGYYSGIEYLAGAAGVRAADGASAAQIPLAVFPNPVSGHVNVVFELARANEVDVALFDACGREVAQLSHGLRPSGRNVVEYAADHLPQGTYFLKITGNAIHAHRVVTIVR